ncbi:hypothetical protein Syun_021207 [Stephania yunnanensis]|uniref:Uncharacterized protein n=1 Tax=Stephania yunnanensis TaxID=152371 RepID=A0AAP0IFM0_9MAGN
MNIIINEHFGESKHKIYMSNSLKNPNPSVSKISISNNTKRITYIRQVERTALVSSNNIS